MEKVYYVKQHYIYDQSDMRLDKEFICSELYEDHKKAVEFLIKRFNEIKRNHLENNYSIKDEMIYFEKDLTAFISAEESSSEHDGNLKWSDHLTIEEIKSNKICEAECNDKYLED